MKKFKWVTFFCLLCPFFVYASVFSGVGSFGRVQITRVHGSADQIARKTFHFDHCAPHEEHALLIKCIQGNEIGKRLCHKGCVKIFHVTNAGDQSEIIMEPLYGITLREFFSRLPDESIQRTIAVQLLEIVAYLQAQAVLHNDIKPANLQFRDVENTQLVLVDFDLMREFSTEIEDINCTYSYVAPELVRNIDTPRLLIGAKLLGKAESFPVGVILHEMATYAVPEECLIMPLIKKLQHCASFGEVTIRSMKKGEDSTGEAGMAMPVGLSDSHLALLRNLLKSNPDDRWSAQEALDKSVWLKKK
jgi:serine/threonine protein kinase